MSTNPIRSLVVDDEKGSRDTLKALIKAYCPEILIVGEADTVSSGIQAIDTLRPDLIFLDIEMPGGSGFDLLADFTTVDFEVIFVTAFDHYALKAIKFCALDYLLKPISILDLQAAVDRMVRKKHEKILQGRLDNLVFYLKDSQSPKNKIAIPSQEGMDFLTVSEIISCVADGAYTLLSTTEGRSILATRSLKEFEELLSEYNFMRVHHKYVVNLDHIQRYVKGEGGFVTLVDQSEVPISRRKKKDFLARLKG